MRTFFTIAKVLSIIFGFIGALSFVRTMSTAFDWYARVIFGNFFSFGLASSVLILFASLSVLVLSIWCTKRKRSSILSRIDFTYVVLLCGIGLYICYLAITGQMRTPWDILQLHDHQVAVRWANMSDFYTVVLVIPVISYLLGIVMLAEFAARLRDRAFLHTFSWIVFFKTYRAQAIGYVAAIFLISQLFLAFYFRYMSIVLISVGAIALMTHIATFLLNLSKTYNAANEDKIRAERFKTELITNVSHDIKTPLTSIISYLDLLKKEDLQGITAEYIHILDKKSTRLKILIDDLTEASKAGTGNLRVDMQEVNLLEIVGQAAGEFDGSFAEKCLTLVIRQPEEAMLYNTDSRHLYRILENLFSNAAKYALDGTRVFAEITTHNGHPCIIVQNTSAIPVDFSDGEATEQFIRGDKSRRTEGSGLGLYIAKSLAELMGGQLHINVSGDLFRVDVFL